MKLKIRYFLCIIIPASSTMEILPYLVPRTVPDSSFAKNKSPDFVSDTPPIVSPSSYPNGFIEPNTNIPIIRELVGWVISPFEDWDSTEQENLNCGFPHQQRIGGFLLLSVTDFVLYLTTISSRISLPIKIFIIKEISYLISRSRSYKFVCQLTHPINFFTNTPDT